MFSIHEPEQHFGKLVALEGDVNIVSRQLRLLPHSSQILVLPSLLEDLPQDTNKRPFNARAFVRDVHAVLTERMSTARSFLQSSTRSHPKLAFMNGGSVTARTTCITKICENVTDGDVREAQTVFNKIVSCGVLGLTRDDEVSVEEAPLKDSKAGSHGENEVPSGRALRTAESLNRENAPSRNGYMAGTEGAENLLFDDREASSEDEEEAPGTADNAFPGGEDDTIQRMMLIHGRPASLDQKRSTFGPYLPLHTSSTAHNRHTVALSQQPHNYNDDVSPSGGSLISVFPTSKACGFDEDGLLNIGSRIAQKNARRFTSVDRFYPSNPRIQERAVSPKIPKHSLSAKSVNEWPNNSDGRMQGSASSGFTTQPKATCTRASQTTIKRFVDRGTDAKEILTPSVENRDKGMEDIKLFEPVFPIVEDLIIYCCDHGCNEIFEDVVRTYKNGSYPIIYSAHSASDTLSTNPSSSSTSTPSHDTERLRPSSDSKAGTNDEGNHRRNEFNHYASYDDSYCPLNISGLGESTQNSTVDSDREPPTPALTPPPTASSISRKFHELLPIKYETAVDLQNALRSVLNIYIPPAETGYRQFYYSRTPEIERLWKPMFCCEQSASVWGKSSTVDRIIALGCEDGVSKDFFASISGQVEWLGIKKGGISRSGKVDLRYLISNALQSFTTQPQSSKAPLDPLSEPALLAAILVPQLEAYLEVNSTTRLLILHYHATELATVLALQRLLGPDLLKVAGVLDSLSSDPPDFASRIISNLLSNENGASRPSSKTIQRPDSHVNPKTQAPFSNSTLSKHKKSPSTVSFAKANYLLPSTATDAEITNFLSGIRRSLAEKDVFYALEPIKNPTVETVSPPRTPSPMMLRKESTSPPHVSGPKKLKSHTRTPTATSRPRTPDNDAVSIKSTTTTLATATERGRREGARERQSEKDWDNFYIGEEDSDDDAYDRMVLGRTGGKPHFGMKTGFIDQGKRKGNSKKALKWLGLA